MVMRLVLCWELIVSANVDPVDFGIAGIYKEAYDPSGLRKSQRCGASCVHIVYAPKKNNRITRYKSSVVLKVSSTKQIHVKAGVLQANVTAPITAYVCNTDIQLVHTYERIL
jgi:hypothetical protein